MSAELPKMPEPVAWASGLSIERIKVMSGAWVKIVLRILPESGDVGLYTADQMRTFAQEAARQAMERTLSICRQMEERGYDAKDCAEAIEDAIRALIPQLEERHG